MGCKNGKCVVRALTFWYNSPAKDGLKYIFCKWNDNELTELANDLYHNTKPQNTSEQKSDENAMSQVLQQCIEFMKQENYLKDLGYQNFRAAILCFNIPFAFICQCTMPKLWDKLVSLEGGEIAIVLNALTDKIFDGSCFKNYESKDDQPDAYLLIQAADQVKIYIQQEIRISKSHKEKSDQTEKWQTYTHFPMMFGLLTPFLVINHFPHRRHESDTGLLTVGTPFDNKEFTRVIFLCKGLMTFLSKWIKLCLNDNIRSKALLPSSAIVYPLAIKTRIEKMQRNKGGTIGDILDFCVALPDFLQWAWNQKKFDHPLGGALNAMYNCKCNWFNIKCYGKAATPALANGADQPHIIGMPTPLTTSILLSHNKLRIVFASKHLKEPTKVRAIVCAKIIEGYELMFNDKNGYNFNDKDIILFDQFARNTGGYPFITRNKYSPHEAWVSLWFNRDYYAQRVLGLVQFDEGIKVNRKLKSWLNKYGNKYEKSK